MNVILGVAGATFLHPDIRDLHGIGVQGKLSWQCISDDGHSAPCSTGVLFANGLDKHAACQLSGQVTINAEAAHRLSAGWTGDASSP
jgi:hypothetical protein